MSKLILKVPYPHDPYHKMDANEIAWVDSFRVLHGLEPINKFIIGSDRYTLDHAWEAEHRPENTQHD